MKWRGISTEEVGQTLTNPDVTVPTENERKNVFKIIGDRYIKVTYKELKDEVLIISAVDKSN